MRTVDVAAAISATEGICDITCDPEITVCKKGICKRGIYADYISDTICAVRDSVSGLVQKTEAKCLQHSDTAVICGTSAYSDNEMPASLLQGVCDHFTNAEGCCMERVSLFIWN